MKKLITTLSSVLAFLIPAHTWAAIAVDTTVHKDVLNQTLNQAITIGSGNDRVLVMCLITEGDRTIDTKELDDGAGGGAQSFTQLGSYRHSNSSADQSSMWYLVNPTSGSRRIHIVTSASSLLGMGAAAYSGVAQTSTFGATDEGENSGNNPETSARTSDVDGSWMTGCVGSGASTISMNSGGVERANYWFAEADDDAIYVDSNATVANTVTNTFNWSGASTGWITAMMRPAVLATAGPGQDLIYLSDE